jgi:hypothetical protein
MPEDRIEPYRLQDGEQWGDELPKPIPTLYGSSTERRGTFVERARLASRRRREDSSWGDKTPESRRLLIDIDLREGRA